jgi:hypothetical protein
MMISLYLVDACDSFIAFEKRKFCLCWSVVSIKNERKKVNFVESLFINSRQTMTTIDSSVLKYRKAERSSAAFGDARVQPNYNAHSSFVILQPRLASVL